jgi:hypothetical protein
MKANIPSEVKAEAPFPIQLLPILAATRPEMVKLLTLCRQYAGRVPEFQRLHTVKRVNGGATEWRFMGRFHRLDGPARELASGYEEWYQHGQLHRADGPAIKYDDETKGWYQHGKLHRDGDLPAVITRGGTREWYQHGQLHRDGDLPAIEKANGAKMWYQHGKRLDGAKVLSEERIGVSNGERVK